MGDAWIYLLRCADRLPLHGLDERPAQAARRPRSRRGLALHPLATALRSWRSRCRSPTAMREEARIKRLSRPQKLALVADGEKRGASAARTAADATARAAATAPA